MGSLRVIYCLCAIVTRLAHSALNGKHLDSMSFYGDSYVYLFPGLIQSQIPFSEDTLIDLEFKTSRPDGLLTLLPATNGHLLLQLEKGRIKVSFRIGTEYKIATEFLSPVSLTKLNDLHWHYVQFSRRKEDFTLTVDGKTTSFRAEQPANGEFFKLDEGAFLGGPGGHKVTDLGHIPNFRGCLGHVKLNGYKVLQLTVAFQSQTLSYRTDRNCSSLFKADQSSAPVSFVASGAFMGFTLAEPQTSMVLYFEIRTKTTNSALLYSSGNPYSNHFLLLKLVDSRLYVVISHVKGILAGHSKKVVSDGRWHRVSIKLADEEFDLSVDETNEKLFDSSVKISIFLGRYLNFGGSEIYSTQELANAKSEGSQGFLGCLHNIVHQYKPLGLKQIDVSMGIQPGCLYQYPCSESPCSPEFECVEFGFSDFQCQCGNNNADSCSDKMSADSTRSPISTSFSRLPERSGKITQPLDVNPLDVIEGGTQRLDWRNLYIFPQFRRFGLSNKDIRFWVAEPPEHGKLTRSEEGSHVHLFSYQDVLDGRLNYTHDSSETTRDSVELEVEFFNYSAEFFPKDLQKRLPYTLPIHIRPLNDPPKIQLLNGRTLRLAHGSKLDITQELILVLDPDTLPSRVKVKILFATPNSGYFELKSAPGVPLSMFSLENLINGQIVYVQTGQLNAEVILMASDEISDSDPVTLHVDAFHIQLRQVVNTGLRVLHGSHELITNANLSFSTNAPSQKLDIQYKIVNIPRRGFVEVQQSNGDWQVTETFNQSQIDRGAIRFRHVRENRPTDDLFKFTATVLDFTALNVFEFRVSFMPVSLRILQQSFVLNNTREKTITREYLFTWTYPKMTPPDETIYHITAPPRSGYLFKVLEEVGSAGRHRRIGLFSNFTQADVNRELIYYKLHYANHKMLRDLFQFKVITPSVTGTNNPFAITYLPGDGSIQLTNRSVLVKEGSLQPITVQHLFLETRDHKDFTFFVLIPPSHGDLKLLVAPNSKKTLGNGTSFTTDDIANDRLFYKHDDSESVDDKTLLSAKPRNTVNNQVEIQFWLTFKVLLLDDNEPKRVNYGRKPPVFYVISSSERLVRQRDLHYADADTDSKAESIVFTFPPSDPNGGFYSARLPDIPVNIFTQKQIDNDEILFRHFGVHKSFGIPFTVSDGKFVIRDNFTVNGSRPFLREFENSGLKLEHGRTVAIRNVNLSMETNLDAKPEEIVYKLTSLPQYGQINVQSVSSMEKSGKKSVEFFTQEDVDAGRVFYEHTSTDRTTLKDVLYLSVHTGDLERTVEFVIVISNETVLRVAANKEVIVSEGGVTVISKDNLEMIHPQFTPASIVYTVVESPIYGSLILEANRRTMGKEVVDIKDFYVHKFTQFDVNAGNLQYMHGNLNQKTDRIVMNVSAGSIQVNYVKLLIRVVKNEIFLETRNFTVFSERSFQLDSTHISARCSYYQNYSFVFTVTDPPKHGWIENRTDMNNIQEVETFTTKDLQSGTIFYTNDGKMFWGDQFSVVAGLVGENLESQPKSVHIRIQHLNIEAPELIKNEVLETLTKKTATITSSNLQFHDMDTSPEEIRYIVTSPENGYVANKQDSNQPIFSFSQKDINDGKIIFVLSEKAQHKGGFSFVVSDGAHQSDTLWFAIQATELNVLLEANNRLIVPPNAKTLVTSATLKASVTKSDPDQVVFTVTQPPHYGELLVDQRQKISQFTQQDVDLGRISYHQNVPITQWVARDTFQFTIAVNTSVGTDQIFEELDEHRFKITISYAALQDSTLRNYIIISPVRLSEGGRVVVNSTYLNVTALSSIAGSNLQMEVTRLPQHGYLEFRGRNVTGDLRFTQMDLVNKLLVYCHTGRGRQAWVDRVSLDVYPISDLMNGKSSKNLLKLRFNLDFLVSSANKERFHDPIYRRTITVVRGFHYNITRDDLFTDDPDTLPNEIIYSIVQGPTNGFFTYFDNPTQPLRRFTQADINKMTVRFCQDGTDREGKFIFQVSDGKFDPVSGEVRVVVEPLTLSLVNLTDVLYYQDENIIKLNSSHLGAVTNGPKTEIYYDITKQPLYGEFYKSNRDNRAVSRFSQTDVDNQAIVYVHLNLDSETDKFEFSVSNSLNRITGKWLSITAVPQLQSHPVSVLPGKTLIITSDILDVSKLAIKTESDPVFQVVEFPMYGVLVKMPPRKKEAFVLLDEPDNIEDVTTPITTGWHTSAEERLASNEELILDEDDVKAVRVRRNEVLRSNATFFTFSELRDQRVKYISTLQPSLANMVRDKFVYRLTAKGVKPAKGTFPLVVTPYLGRTPEVITAASPTSELTPPYLPAQPDISTDYTVAICLVSVIIVLAVLIIVVRKVRVELKRQTLQKKKAAAMSTSGLITPKPDLLGTSLYSAMTDSQLHVDTTGGNEQPTRDSSMARSASKQSASGGGVRNGSSNKGVSHYSLASPYHTSMSPKGTNTAGSPNFLSPHEGSDVSASAVARLITFDPGRTEIVSSIPLCRVTPLTPKPSSTCSSSSEDWRYAYHYSSSASEHDSKLSQDKLSLDRNNGSGKGRRGQKPQPKLSRQMKLKDNQYWV